MKFEKKFEKYYSDDGMFTISITATNRRKFHGKYCISKRGTFQSKYADTLKEAKQIAKEWK